MTHFGVRSYCVRRRNSHRMAMREQIMDPTKLLDDEPGIVPVEEMEAADELSAPTQDEIACLAYSYWEARGYQGGAPTEDWKRAEEELKQRQSRETLRK